MVTGFGNKTDYSTGRVLNLDKTYEQLIRPAFDKVSVNGFRAIDANVTGSIDSIMYRWIYQADMVIADLSTLNANVFYELGVRHAQRPSSMRTSGVENRSSRSRSIARWNTRERGAGPRAAASRRWSGRGSCLSCGVIAVSDW